MTIPLSVKKKCIEMRESGMSMPDIYRTYFADAHPEMGYQTFRHKLRHWLKQRFADEMTLEKGTYEGFIAHGATVQVNGRGEVVQAWIKEHADDNQMARLIECIEANTTPIEIERVDAEDQEPEMLEIPLFDQHFPQNDHIYAFVINQPELI